MAGPGDEIAADRGHLRASHADREQVIGTLKAAFVRGMLDRDEFGQRLGQTFAARTHAELTAVTADLPAGLADAQPPKPARAQGEARVPRPGIVIAVATALYAAVWVNAPLSANGGDNRVAGALVFWGGFVYLIVLLFAGAQVLADRQDKRSGGQLPSQPGAGGPAAGRLPPAGPARQLPPAGHGHQNVAEAARSRRPPSAPSVRRGGAENVLACRRPMSKAARAGICAAMAIAVPVVLSFATGAPIPLFIFAIFYLMLLTIELGARWSEKRWRVASARSVEP